MQNDARLISGEQSNVKLIFARGDYVYLNKGSNQGIRVGDRFYAIRPVTDLVQATWFKWQDKLMKAMGTVYTDTGQLVVISVTPNVSTAQVTFTCNYMQRGDFLRPMVERPSPPYKPTEKFDHFAPVSGKPVGMLVIGEGFLKRIRAELHRLCKPRYQSRRQNWRLFPYFPISGIPRGHSCVHS